MATTKSQPYPSQRGNAAESGGIGESCQAAMHQCQETVEHAVTSAPATVVFTAFGVGIALGVIAGVALFPARPAIKLATAESIGRRVLDSLTNMLPQSVSQHLCG